MPQPVHPEGCLLRRLPERPSLSTGFLLLRRGRFVVARVGIGAGWTGRHPALPGNHVPGGLVITRNMTVIGAGANSTVIDLSGGTVGITSGVTAELRGLRIQNGRSPTSGGGVLNAGSLVLRQCQVTGNLADAGGGGIANLGTLTLVDSAVSDNRAGSVGGGIYNADGRVILRGTTRVARNAGGSEGGGIFSEGTSSRLELHDDSAVTENVAGTSGGGIYNASGPDAVAFFGRSRVTANQPNDCTGTLTCPS